MTKGVVVGIDILAIMVSPRVDASWMGILQREDEVEVIHTFAHDSEHRDGWLKIAVDDIYGYVRSRYIRWDEKADDHVWYKTAYGEQAVITIKAKNNYWARLALQDTLSEIEQVIEKDKELKKC